MAQEEIKLVGSFKDDITPSLKKLNRELGNIARTFERFNKKIAPVTKSFAKMAMSARTFSDAMQGQRRAIESSSRAMSEYSRQAGKMGSAMRRVQAQRERAQRQMGVSRAQMRKGGMVGGMPAPKGGGRGGTGAAAGVGKGMGMSFVQAVGASGLGIMLGQSMMGIIGAGMRGLTGLAMKPVNYLMDKFNDRVRDEMADLKSAGGLYAIDMEAAGKSGQKQLFNSVTDALQFQERLNIDAAKSAASLPGVTQQYVDVKRQLTDTVQMVMELGKGEGKGAESREAFVAFGESLGADVSAGGDTAIREAFSQVLGDITEKTVLVGQGQQGGLPMHIFMQELINKQVNNKGELGIAAMTKKYRAAFKTNPMLKKFLNDAEQELTKTSAGSVERLQMVNEILSKAMPAEVIAKMRGTISGMQEAFNSAFFDQQSGLFGLSRPVENMAGGTNKIKRAVNDFSEVMFEVGSDITYETKDGQQKFTKGMRVSSEQLTRLGVNFEKFGDTIKVNGEALEKAMDQSYLFEVIRETMSGFGVGTLQLAGLIPQIYDPFFDAVQALMPVRDIAQAFNKDVVATAKYFEGVADQMKGRGDAKSLGAANVLRKQALLRGSISTFADTLADFGAISKETQDAINEIAAPKNMMDMSGAELEAQNLGKALPMIFEGVMQTDLVRKTIPEAVGKMIGSLVKAAGEFIIGMFKGFADQDNVLKVILDNMKEGFFAAFGEGDEGRAAFGAMIEQVGQIASKLLGEALKAAFDVAIPAMAEVIKIGFKALFSSGPLGAALAVGVPTAIAFFVDNMLLGGKAIGGAFKFIGDTLGSGGGNIWKMLGLADVAKATDALDPMFKGLRGMGGVFKSGLLSGLKGGALGGIIRMITGLFEGKSLFDAFAEGLTSMGGSAIGGMIGSIFGPIGTLIGAFIGGFLADFQPAVDAFKGIIGGVMDFGGTIMDSIGPLFGAFGDAFGSLVDLVVMMNPVLGTIFNSLGGIGDGFDFVHAALIATKVVLTPIIAALQLVEIVLLGFSVAVKGLEVGFAQIMAWIANSIFGVGMDGAKANKELAEKQSALADSTKKVTEANKRHMEWYKTPKPGENVPGFKQDPTGQTAPAAGVPALFTPPAPAAPGVPALFTPPTSGTPAPGTPAAPPIPTPEETGVAEVARNTDEAKGVVEQTNLALNELKPPVMELPMRMDESMMKQTMELSTIIGTYMVELCAKADEVVAALASKEQDMVTIANPLPLPVQMSGLAGALAGLKTGGGKAAGTPLGMAIREEMKNKPPGSSLVVANSSETIIPAHKGYMPRQAFTAFNGFNNTGGGGGGGDIHIGAINVSGVDDPKQIADEVAKEILLSVRRTSYSELNVS